MGHTRLTPDEQNVISGQNGGLNPSYFRWANIDQKK
jgi:hypothetical protein